jgi:hypothetical protein
MRIINEIINNKYKWQIGNMLSLTYPVYKKITFVLCNIYKNK